jgi:hypothetical protein
MAPHPKGRTYDRTVPGVKSTEKPLHWRAVPHMRKKLDANARRSRYRNNCVVCMGCFVGIRADAGNCLATLVPS